MLSSKFNFLWETSFWKSYFINFFSARWELKSVDFAHPAQKLFSVRSIDYLFKAKVWQVWTLPAMSTCRTLDPHTGEIHTPIHFSLMVKLVPEPFNTHLFTCPFHLNVTSQTSLSSEVRRRGRIFKLRNPASSGLTTHLNWHLPIRAWKGKEDS